MIRCAVHPEVPLKRTGDRVETCPVCLSEARSGDDPGTLRVEWGSDPIDPLAGRREPDPIIPPPRRPTDAQIGGDSPEPIRWSPLAVTELLRRGGLRCGLHDTELVPDESGMYAICPQCANDGQVLDDMAAEAQLSIPAVRCGLHQWVELVKDASGEYSFCVQCADNQQAISDLAKED